MTDSFLGVDYGWPRGGFSLGLFPQGPQIHTQTPEKGHPA